jgi:hypothetical protein
MQSVSEIIEARGGWAKLPTHPITVEVPGFMDLHLEWCGTGPRGGRMLSVAHTYLQQGDVMHDPEVVVEFFPEAGWWLPLSYRQDNLGVYREAVSLEGDGLVVRSPVVRELQRFLKLWDANLREQGFVEAARKPT